MFDEASVQVDVRDGLPGIDDDASWREAHLQLQRIARRRKTLDVEEARWLLIARSQRVHEQLGFGSFLEYMERILDYAPRTALERLRVAEELEQLPETRARLATDELSYSAVRAITRAATPETEHDWLAQVHGKSMREIEALFRGRRKGDKPSDVPDPAIEPRRWTVDLEPDVYASILEARRCLEEEHGGRLNDSAFVAALCERAMADRAGAGAGNERPPFQVALTVCDRCDRATQDGAGHIVEVAPSVVAQARCDAEYVGHLDAETPARLTTEIPPATRRLIFRRDHGRCSVPGCRAAKHLQIHHIIPREAGGDHSPSNLTLLCGAHHRALHDGKLVIRGTAPDQLTFEHRDGRRYGEDPLAQTRAALRRLGFKTSEVDAAIARASVHVSATVGIEDFLRACLLHCPRPTA